jgi:D-alanyl-D-alanine carboxypeptidase
MTSGVHRSRAWIGLVVAAMVMTGACSRADSRARDRDPHETPDLERALTWLAPQGTVALLRTDGEIWRASSGEAESGRPAEPQDRFEIASITKTFVATVVLQLVEESRLSLEDSIEDVLPGILPYGRQITVRQLLNHSSGLDDSHFSEVSPRKTLDLIAAAPPLSRPGTRYSYANVNYVVLGVIVEEITGRPLEQVVLDRIFRPLGLEDTSYGSSAIGSNADGSWLGYPVGRSDHVVGAGGIVSSVDDVATFFRALLGGELIGPELLSEMTRTIDGGQGYRAGLGIFDEELSCGDAWGHGGELPTYSSMAIASRDGSKVVVVAQNGSGWTAALEVAEEIYCS